MSYAQQLLYTIGDQLGRNRKDMDPYVKVLEKNWYDTRQSMRSLTMKQLQNFNFPARLIQMILDRLSSNKSNKNIPQNVQSQKLEIENLLSSYINQLKNKANKNDFDQIITLLLKIFSNIRDNITEQKYRHLKKSNERIAKLTSLPDVELILKYGGFHNSNEGYTMKNINFSHINQCIEQISKFMPKVQFNPYQQQIISLSTATMNSFEGETTSVVYNDKLAELEKQREAMMSKPIKDRDIKIFQVKSELAQKMDVQFNEKEELNEDQKIYMQNVKQILKKSGQDPKFMNRRKKQYYDLLKKPCFTQTTVRVKLPNHLVFQCKFSPLETIQSLVDIFHDNLENKNIDYYLYMTPPVEKLKGILLRKTFYELGCTPKAVFYFKTEQEIKGNIFKEKKTGFFSSFFS